MCWNFTKYHICLTVYHMKKSISLINRNLALDESRILLNICWIISILHSDNCKKWWQAEQGSDLGWWSERDKKMGQDQVWDRETGEMPRGPGKGMEICSCLGCVVWVGGYRLPLESPRGLGRVMLLGLNGGNLTRNVHLWIDGTWRDYLQYIDRTPREPRVTNQSSKFFTQNYPF